MIEISKNLDVVISGNQWKETMKYYTRVPNMLVDGYQELLPQEKWLYVCLVGLCGKEATRFLSLRYIAERTGFSLGALSTSKKSGSPGMLWRLHEAGLLHVEIKRPRSADGKEKKNAQFHVTILDLWQKNTAFFSGSIRSEGEQVQQEAKAGVREPNVTCSTTEQMGVVSVQNANETCSDSSTKRRLRDNSLSPTITGEEIPLHTLQNDHEAAAAPHFLGEHVEGEETTPTQQCCQETMVVRQTQNKHQDAIQCEREESRIPIAEQPASSSALPFVPSVPIESIVIDDKIDEALLTDECLVQYWERLRGQNYGKQARSVQLRAAQELLCLELPLPLSLQVLKQIYETVYDDFWKEKYGELHLSHLIASEKSSGQVRVIRWINRLRFQTMKQRDVTNPDLAKKSVQRVQEEPAFHANFHRYRPGDDPNDDAFAVVRRLQVEGNLPQGLARLLAEKYERVTGASGGK